MILCRFMLSLRQFDARMASTMRSGPGIDSRVLEHTTSAVLQFAAQPTDSLPPFLSSFGHPVHLESTLSGTGSDEDFGGDGSDGEEMLMDAAPVQSFDDPALSKSGP